MCRRFGADPSLVESAVDDGLFDLLDRHRVVVDGKDTCRFARGRTQAAGELREVVGGVESLDGRLPVVTEDEVVPLRDEIPERTSVVTEGNAAVHAARALVAQHLQRQWEVDLAVVTDALRHRSLLRGVSRVLQKTSAGRHQLTSSSFARRARRYSSGITLTNRSRSCGQVRSNRCATALPGSPALRSSRPRTRSWSSRPSGSSATDARL